MTHYERLGVAPEASTQEVRDAYRRAARRLHPDAAGEHSAQQMAAVNQAWWVLRDPERRRAYDLSLPGPSSGSASGSSSGSSSRPSAAATSVVDDGPPPRASFNPLSRYQDPPRFPWRFMAVLATIGIAVILIGVAFASPSTPRPPDNVLTTGSCVVIQSNGDAAEVDCASAHDAVVVTLVGFDERCEFGLEAHRDRQGMGVACVRRE